MPIYTKSATWWSAQQDQALPAHLLEVRQARHHLPRFSPLRRRSHMATMKCQQNLANRLDETEDLEVVLCIDIRREIGSTANVAQILKGYAAKFVETEWPGERFPRLYYDPRSLSSESGVRSALHAKCVAVDSMEALVTSANFTEAAQLRNIELGLHVKSPPIARQIEGHFYSLIRSGHLERLPLP